MPAHLAGDLAWPAVVGRDFAALVVGARLGALGFSALRLVADIYRFSYFAICREKWKTDESTGDEVGISRRLHVISLAYPFGANAVNP